MKWDRVITTFLVLFVLAYCNGVSARYITSDPIGLAGGTNTYTYANGNPLNTIDPSGQNALVASCFVDPAQPICLAGLGLLAYGAMNAANNSNTCDSCDSAVPPSGDYIPDPCDLFPDLCIPNNQGSRPKPVNLPSASKIQVDMDHIASGHIQGGSRVSSAKTLFPQNMTQGEIEQAIREAYRFCKRIETQGPRVLTRGQAQGMDIEMWVNTQTNIIETAYPIY